MKNQEKVASFINKLYNILKSKQHSKAIIWDTQQNGIRIVNQKRLEETVLPRYYRHNRFASFVRQLNMYDFHKIHLGDHKSVFIHDTFNPKDKQSIYIVKRKVTFNLQSSDKSSNSLQVQKQLSQQKSKKCKKPQNQLQSINNMLPTQQQKISKGRSSFNMVKNSIKILSDLNDISQKQMSQEQAIEQILQQILPLNLAIQEMKIKIRKLQKRNYFKKFLKNKQFKKTLYQRLGIEFDNNKQNLSELSIEGGLMIQTRRTLSQMSLKMFESGPLCIRDTLNYLMSI